MEHLHEHFCRPIVFVMLIIFTAAAIIGLYSCTSKKEIRDTGQSDNIIQSVTGKSMQELRDWYANELFNHFIPNMDKYVIDHEYGGFMCAVDIKTGELLSTHKRAWYEGRGLWTYSFLYNNFMRDEKILETAKKSLDFILQHKPPKGSFWPSSYTRDGRILEEAGDANPWIDDQGDIYGHLFVAEGLTEYAKAVGDNQYYELAKSILFDALDIYDNPEYRYHVSYLSADAPLIPGVRVLGHWMVLLRAVTQMLAYKPDPDIEKVADRCVEAIMKHHLNNEYQLLNEALCHDFTLSDNEFNQFVYIGHGIETLWIVMFEAVRRNDKELLQQSMDAFKRHVIVAHDAVYGGSFRSLDHVDNNTWKTDKVLWLQEEILIGTLFMVEQTKDEWAQKYFAETYNYVCEKFVRDGYKFWIHGGDRTMEEFYTNRAEHYHHPRHLMLNILTLDRILNTSPRNGEEKM